MAPATPTGLHVDEVTETSIEWHWNAVEGALAYAVQISMDEMFDATDTIDHSLENHYTVSDLEPGTSVYLRVAAAAGTLEAPILSPWSTHVTGTADVPPPPPPPMPDPVMVGFMVPDGEFPMEPDDEDDKETAMATVNHDIMVMSNTSAVITAMWLDDANGVSLASGENMPFAHVDWGALQADVVSDGVTFMIQRTTMGANQEMEPTGDVAYVTCGPFACMDGADAPEISIADSAVCAGWDPSVELEVGWVNNEIDTAPDTDGMQDAMDGVDLGWRTTSSAGMSVTHHFSGVANGQNLKVSGPGAGKGTSEAYAMTSSSVGPSKYSPALFQDLGTDGAVGGTGDDADSLVCAGTGATDPYGGSTANALDKPEECFRVNTRGSTKTNYLSGYSIELQANASAVGWGEIDWDAFDDLTCDSMTFAASDLVDVCDLFADEVEQALDAGWAGSKGTAVNFVLATGDADTLMTLEIPAPTSASSYRFATNWFNPSGKGDPGTDIYNDTDDTTDGVQRAPATLALLDADDDPKFGDFGKVDFEKRAAGDEAPSTDAGSWVFGSDGTAENANSATDNKCSDDDGGEACDAEFTEMMEFTFASGSALGCKETVMVEVTCTWDANGEMGRYRADDHEVDGADGSPGSFFGDFELTETGGDRTAGYIGAFAKCTVN